MKLALPEYTTLTASSITGSTLLSSNSALEARCTGGLPNSGILTPTMACKEMSSSVTWRQCLVSAPAKSCPCWETATDCVPGPGPTLRHWVGRATSSLHSEGAKEGKVHCCRNCSERRSFADKKEETSLGMVFWPPILREAVWRWFLVTLMSRPWATSSEKCPLYREALQSET